MKHRNSIIILTNDPNSWEQGFTILETLTAIAVISLSTLIIAGFLASTIKLTGRVRDTLTLSVEMLKADEQLRRETAAVAIPYWERRVDIVQTPSYTAVPWYGGEEAQTLELNINSGNDNSGKFPTIIGVNILRDSNEKPYGIDIVQEYHGRTVHTSCCFSTLPVRTGQEP
jgi:type II secretory pathway pseudopilin PulG